MILVSIHAPAYSTVFKCISVLSKLLVIVALVKLMKDRMYINLPYNQLIFQVEVSDDISRTFDTLHNQGIIFSWHTNYMKGSLVSAFICKTVKRRE